MKKHPDMIHKFLTHMGSASIMDLLLKLISMDDSESGILQVRTRTDLTLKLMSWRDIFVLLTLYIIVAQRRQFNSFSAR